MLSERIGTYTATTSGHSTVICMGPVGVKGKRYDLYVDDVTGDFVYRLVK